LSLPEGFLNPIRYVAVGWWRGFHPSMLFHRLGFLIKGIRLLGAGFTASGDEVLAYQSLRWSSVPYSVFVLVSWVCFGFQKNTEYNMYRPVRRCAGYASCWNTSFGQISTKHGQNRQVRTLHRCQMLVDFGVCDGLLFMRLSG
jgi:hypothetical protein